MAKYVEKEQDGLRKEFMKFILLESFESDENTSNNGITFNPCDVTGSLGCWGVEE